MGDLLARWADRAASYVYDFLTRSIPPVYYHGITPRVRPGRIPYRRQGAECSGHAAAPTILPAHCQRPGKGVQRVCGYRRKAKTGRSNRLRVLMRNRMDAARCVPWGLRLVVKQGRFRGLGDTAGLPRTGASLPCGYRLCVTNVAV